MEKAVEGLIKDAKKRYSAGVLKYRVMDAVNKASAATGEIKGSVRAERTVPYRDTWHVPHRSLHFVG